MLTLILIATALADPAADLAPGPAELSAHIERTGAHLARAEALEIAANRLQNTWGARLAAGTLPPKPCTDPELASIAARMSAFGEAWRDAAQSARAEGARLDRAIAAPTVAPLLDESSTAATTALGERVKRQVRAYEEHLAWTRAHVPLRTCPTELSPAPGIASAVPRAKDERRPTAIIGIGGGLICPVGLSADGNPAVLSEPQACWTASSACDCTPSPVQAGAVLGRK